MFTFLVLILVILILVILISIVGICWYFASRLLSRTSRSAFSILITDIDKKVITLQRTKNTGRPGVFGIKGTDGQAILGPILSVSPHTVARQLIQSTGTLSPQTKVAWNTTIYGGKLTADLKLTINEVSIPGPLGEMPAMFVAGNDLWAILVHGSTGTRDQGLRAFRTLADLGLSILTITYRNDEGAPSSSDGQSHLGDSEWEDLEASVKYALAHGAQRILLYGWSMGGTVVKTFLDRSSYANKVAAAVLDSPVLNWRATLDALTRKYFLPPFFARLTGKIISMRTGIEIDTLNQLNWRKCHIPILLFHGLADTTAPVTISDTFASTHTTVRYHRVPNAEHTQCWNANHEKYEAELHSFLIEVLDLR